MSELSETPFRVYRLADVDDNLDQLSFLGAADGASLGDLLCDLEHRGRIDGKTRVGIMLRPVDGEPGKWIVTPWA